VAAAGPKAESPYQVNWPPGIVTVTIVAASRHVPSATSAASAATNSATAAASELPVPAPVLIQEYLGPVRSAHAVSLSQANLTATAPGRGHPHPRRGHRARRPGPGQPGVGRRRRNPPPSGSQPRRGNPACGRPIERQATGRPARYCSGSWRQAVHRVRLADADRQRWPPQRSHVGRSPPLGRAHARVRARERTCGWALIVLRVRRAPR
jgi:hypothetical protein